MATKTKLLKDDSCMDTQIMDNQTSEAIIELVNTETIDAIIEDVETINKENKKEVSKMTTNTMLKPNLSDEFKNQLRSELKVIRALVDWSQKDLCEALGTATTQITSVEREDKHFTDTQYFVLLYLLSLELKRNIRLKKYMNTNCEFINTEISKFFN